MAKAPSFYNSFTKKVEPLVTLESGRVKIYHCGPTVYKRQHIGNMRRFLFADFLNRTLKFLGYELDDTMNITDVGHLTQDDIDSGEDKLEKEAREKKTTPQEISKEQIELFKQDLADLNIEKPKNLLKATNNIDAMIDLIKKLEEKDMTYQTKAGVYFDVTKFPSYGALSGNTLEKLQAGARIEVDDNKKNPADFALWKLDDPDHAQQWGSPWGKGYPGWHVECSAMAGDQIDIHTGGQDNKFPHHENEIAQSEGASGKTFSKMWIHNAWLQLAGEKLAKREGEQITIDTIKEKGFSPLAFRLLVFGSHYRKPLEFSWESLAAAQEQLEGIKSLLHRLSPPFEGGVAPPNGGDVVVLEKFTAALGNDLNTPEALAEVMKYIKETNSKIDSNQPVDPWPTLLAFDQVLGIFTPLLDELKSAEIPADIRAMADEREKARQAKNFEDSDNLRKRIEDAGYSLEDTPQGPRIIKE